MYLHYHVTFTTRRSRSDRDHNENIFQNGVNTLKFVDGASVYIEQVMAGTRHKYGQEIGEFVELSVVI